MRFVTAIDGIGNPTKTFLIDNSGNINASGNITGTSFSANGTITGGSDLTIGRHLLAGGNITSGADITSGLNININPVGALNFGATTRQMINLYKINNSNYGIGIQANTFYSRTDSDFTWYKGGVHSDTQGSPGAGGFYLMGLSTAGLSVNGTFVSLSDRNRKENFAEIDSRQVLEKVAALPIQTWNYTDDDNKVRHIGPMAQDFYAAFNVGPDDKHITTVDEGGIALAAIKALKVENDALKVDYEVMKERLERIERQLAGFK